MYDFVVRPTAEKTFSKIARENPKQLERIFSKIQEILRNPTHYKNLKKPLQHLRRVHIDKSFVLLFSVDEMNELIIIEYFDHQDNIYK